MSTQKTTEKPAPALRFHIELPKSISLMEVKFALVVNDSDFKPIDANVIDEGGGAYLEISTAGETVPLNPEELDEITKTLLDVCKFIDGQEKK